MYVIDANDWLVTEETREGKGVRAQGFELSIIVSKSSRLVPEYLVNILLKPLSGHRKQEIYAVVTEYSVLPRE